MYTDETGSVCYWVPDNVKNTNTSGFVLDYAKDVCKKHGGYMAAPFTRGRLSHINDTNILDGTGTRR